jgi:hypothetical protein
MPDKVIVTNLAALRAKYGRRGLARVRVALARLIGADRRRGLSTGLVALDVGATMKRLRAPRVTDPHSTDENKAAVDGVWRHLRPDYLVLLGSVDVIPHQRLINPVHDGDDDPDEDPFIPSDLPYACDAPHSLDANSFVGPTRVVGRLPDLTGARQPDYLLAALAEAAGWVSRPRPAYEQYFAVSAWVWRRSTAKTLVKLFGSPADLRVSPPGRASWAPGLLARRVHFINCHGATEDPTFYGERADRFPPAGHAAYFGPRLKPGTVAAVEACYGAELYDPRQAHRSRGFCYAYLGSGAYGYFGSSTITYGESDTMRYADLLCRYFMKPVLDGASLGRAALDARHQFAQVSGELDPVEIKTLAQFNLMGDPSIHPVAADGAAGSRRAGGRDRPRRGGTPVAGRRSLPPGRSLRRLQAAERGVAVANTVAVPKRAPGLAPGPRVRRELARLARRAGVQATKVLCYRIEGGALSRSLLAHAGGRGAFYIVAGRRPRLRAPVRTRMALVVREQAGELTVLARAQRR